MLLQVSPYGSVTIEHNDGTIDDIQFGRFYELPDGHKVIFNKVGQTVVVQIKKGKKVVQSGSLPRLSFVGGHDSYLEPHVDSWPIPIGPEVPIFPVRQLVEKLFAMGLRYWEITPMFRDKLCDNEVNGAKSVLSTDGLIDRVDLPAEGRYKGGTELTVHDASWAVRTMEHGGVQHVYVWMNAAEPENESVLLDKIRQIMDSAPSSVTSSA
jgi:hypothetical protein